MASTTAAKAPGPIVWINAKPGTGKFTVGKCMVIKDPEIILVDNHSVIDPVSERLGPNSRAHPRYQEERKLERQRMFAKTIHEESLKDRTIVFTDNQSTDQCGSSVAKEHEEAALAAGRPFIPVNLECDEAINFERALSVERFKGERTKLTDRSILELVLKETMYRFDKEKYPGLEVDTTKLSAEEVADMILAHLRGVKEKAGQV